MTKDYNRESHGTMVTYNRKFNLIWGGGGFLEEVTLT